MLIRFGATAALIVFFLTAAVPAAGAEQRVALVIGNSAYARVPKLANPANDATAVADLLRAAKFDVVQAHHDLGAAQIRRVLRDFSDSVSDADIAVVYFAGHGIEVEGTNYLIPVDAVLARDLDVEDEALSLDRVLRILEPAKRLRLVILDACRDNPFIRIMKRTIGTRAISRGLARVEPMSPDTLVAFAAKAGSTAFDGDDNHSPFTASLLKHIAAPGLDLRIALGRVRDDVLKTTARRQEPFVYGSLGGSTVALVPPLPEPKIVTAPPTAPIDPTAGIRHAYEIATQIGTKEAWDSFLAAHTSGLYADLARAQRAKLLATERAQQIEAEQANLKSAEALKAAEQAKLKAEREVARMADQLARLQAEQAKIVSPAVVATAPAQPDVDATKAPVREMEPGDVARLLQAHLKRVGCDPGQSDGSWDDRSRKALENFNKNAGMKLEVKVASLDALDAVKGKTSRICPLLCGKNQRVEGERCIEIACKARFVRNSEGDCVRQEAPRTAARTPPATNPTPARSGGGLAAASQLREACTNTNDISACRQLCSAGFERACQKAGRLEFGKRHSR